jgi:hypothetical protein
MNYTSNVRSTWLLPRSYWKILESSIFLPWLFLTICSHQIILKKHHLSFSLSPHHLLLTRTPHVSLCIGSGLVSSIFSTHTQLLWVRLADILFFLLSCKDIKSNQRYRPLHKHKSLHCCLCTSITDYCYFFQGQDSVAKPVPTWIMIGYGSNLVSRLRVTE